MSDDFKENFELSRGQVQIQFEPVSAPVWDWVTDILGHAEFQCSSQQKITIQSSPDF